MLAVILIRSQIAAAGPGDLIMRLGCPGAGPSGEQFGYSVAAGEGLLVAGARTEIVSAGWINGAAYAFDALTGKPKFPLFDPHPSEGDLFGSIVSVADGRIYVGAWNDKNPITFQGGGGIHGFDAMTGAALHSIYNPTPFPFHMDWCGSAVLPLGEYFLVGAWGEASPPGMGGAVFAYARRDGEFLMEIPVPSPASAGFGYSFAAFGDGARFAVGTKYADNVSLYETEGFRFIKTIYNPDTNLESFAFGVALAGHGDLLLIGDPVNDIAGRNKGAIY